MIDKYCEEKKDVFYGIDLLKLIASILILVLHTIETTNYIACGIKFVFTRFAVPFFFIASGFFFYRGLINANDKKRYFINYEKKLIRIFLVWCVLIYGPFTISSYVSANSGAGVIKIILMLIRRIFIIGSGPYWYLVALICSVAFLYFCYSKRQEWLLMLGIVIGFALQFSYANFRGILSGITVFKYLFDAIYLIYSWEFNFIMYGIPFMGIGYIICKKNMRLDIKISAGIFIIATIVRVFEYYLPRIFIGLDFWNGNEVSFVFIVQAIAYFMFAKEIKVMISKNYSITIRQLSSFIYFSHAIILYNIINPLLEKITNINIYSPLCIIPKVFIVLCICLVLFWGIKRINNRSLNILING